MCEKVPYDCRGCGIDLRKHEDGGFEHEANCLASKLGECRNALTEIYDLSGDVKRHDDMTLPEINTIALGALQEPPK